MGVFAETIAALMGSHLIVFGHPGIEVVLQLADGIVDLLAEGDSIELIQHSLVEPLADAVGLRALGLGAGVIDVLRRKVEFIFVTVMGAAEFGATIGQDPLQRHTLILVERDDRSLSRSGRGDRGLAVVELGEADLGVGVDEGLLIDPPTPLRVPT